VVLVFGLTITILGVVLLLAPVPACLIILAGLAILGIEFEWARNLFKKTHSYINSFSARKVADPGTEKRSARASAGIVGLAVIGSRIFGLIRELVLAAMFGAGKYLDSFLAAFQIPNLLRDLFAEGALSTAFTTVFTRTWEKEGQERSWRLASMVFSSVILAGGLLCTVGILISPLIVNLTSFGFHEVPGKFELTVKLTRIMFPFIIFVALAAVVMGVLNSRHIFGLPASASTVFNIVSVVAAITLAYAFDPQADWRRPHFGESALYGAALGVLLGGMAQLAVQLPAMWRQGFTFTWKVDFTDSGLRDIWRLMWPSIIAGSAVQVNVLINGIFASHVDGARSWLNCAFRLMQFPIGVFGVAIATVTLPAVARHHARGDLSAFGNTVREALRLTLFLTIPAAAGLFVLAPDLIGLIYQHGSFTARDTAMTAWTLRAYSLGLAGYAALKVVTPCFYALGLPKIPLRISLIAIALNVVLNSVMLTVMGFDWIHMTLALATASIATVNFAQLIVHLRSRVAIGSPGEWVGFSARLALGTIGCALAAWSTRWLVAPMVGTGTGGRLLTVLAAVIAGVLFFAAITIIGGMSEIKTAVKIALSRIAVRRPAENNAGQQQ